MKFIHLEDSGQDHLLVCRALKALPFDWDITRVETIVEFSLLIAEGSVDLILADYRLPGFTALDAFQEIQKRLSPPPFVVVSGTIGEAAAVAAIHMGVSDYVHKDNLNTLARVLLRALEVHKARIEKEAANAELARSEKRLAEFASYLQTAIEMERAAIAREIHDDIGGSLTAAKLDLAWLGRHTHDEATNSHVQAAMSMLQHALGASQRIMLNLRPAILDQGLFAAVQWLANAFEKRTNIKTILRSNRQDLSASKPIQLAAYRTTQEALTNASKYADCSLVCIDISDAEETLTVEITDNGVGLTENALNKANSFGIRGLQERAKTVGGWLDVSSSKGAGVSITLTVPLNPKFDLEHES
jgi:two-component system sensor histidine kinase UhpB